MAYIIKDTSALINTRLTDVGRRKISQGSFNIAYFQIGDSELSYSAVSSTYNNSRNNILMPAFNAQNDTGSPQSNKQNVKYPYYVSGNEGNTYGIPFMDSQVQSVYNAAGEKGFFVTGGTQGNWTAETSSAYTITSNYVVDLTTINGTNQVEISVSSPTCSATTGTPSIGDIMVIIYDPNPGCGDISTYPVLTYRIEDLTPSTGTTATTFTVTLDRVTPDYSGIATAGQESRVLIYPSGMTVLYDFKTPAPFWQTDTLNFESPCDVSNRENTLIWNMNIPWSENPAGLFDTTNEGYTGFGSVTYLGTKEYLGYQEPSGQTDTSEVYYYNSFDEKVVVTPKEQKAIAIIHYTNQDIDNVYGEKFSTTPFDPQNPTDSIGLARHLKLTIPTLMWHKSTGNTIGETFWIDPPGYDLCKPYYIKSSENLDMNDPGIRYFHLWDLNPDDNNNLNRVGKVFPDQEIIVIDDEEVIASMSYKANRNWTLSAPKLSLLTPNTCFSDNQSALGLFSASTQKLYVSYRLDTNAGFTNSLHCNYYSSIQAPSNVTASTQNVAVRFGSEFPFLNPDFDTNYTGFTADSIKLLIQMVTGDTKPSPTNWYEIDVTSDFTATTVNGYLTQSGLTGTTIEISLSDYQTAITGSPYNLNTYIDLTPLNSPEVLNFGDEYFFYGNFTTDITATIYEMKYLITLGRNQFTNTSNPTWQSGTTAYVSEIGLYDSNKDLIVISKLQSPEKRQGIQQYVVKLDF
jgi:hypothetical protein